jgi:DNA-binding GntR family transcriptional regulator
MQLRLRGRMAQSMAEHEAVVDALRAGEEQRAAEVLRGHVAIQGEKFHLLMSSLRDAAE